ncbi:BC1872 family protein [Anaerobacillus sp. MEB173]|uniref:BC1872 family protein n=1 Tax=Anaerobacillus sp. MEB173 TaxID=3383345 RepID=UPI003F8DE4C4
MNKTEAIARRILGWKLNSWDKWYDSEKETIIHDSEFQPEQNLVHAMLIVDRLEKVGFTYIKNGDYEVCFKNEFHTICDTGDTLAEAITNAAHLIADRTSKADDWL